MKEALPSPAIKLKSKNEIILGRRAGDEGLNFLTPTPLLPSQKQN